MHLGCINHTTVGRTSFHVAPVNMYESLQDPASSKALVITSIIASVAFFGLVCFLVSLWWRRKIQSRSQQHRSLLAPPARPMPAENVEAAARPPLVNITVAPRRVCLPRNVSLRPFARVHEDPDNNEAAGRNRLVPRSARIEPPLRRNLASQTTVYTTIYEEIELERIPSNVPINPKSVDTLPRYPSPPPSYRSGSTGNGRH